MEVRATTLSENSAFAVPGMLGSGAECAGGERWQEDTVGQRKRHLACRNGTCWA